MAPAGVAPSHIDGIYGGQVCLGSGPLMPARCFRGQSTVVGSRISGVWPKGVDGAMTLVSGMIGPAGGLTIELRPGPGSPMLRPALLFGTLRDGQLDAKGTMVNGRSVSLTWRHN